MKWVAVALALIVVFAAWTPGHWGWAQDAEQQTSAPAETPDTAAAGPSAPADLPDVLDARVSGTEERARVIIDLSNAADYAIATIEASGPVIAVDVRADKTVKVPARLPASNTLVTTFAVEMAAPDRVRTWLRLSTPSKVQQAYVVEAFEGQPARLVVDLIPASEEEFRARAALDRAGATPEQNEMAQAPITPDVVSEDNPAKPLIVLDPGHGGVDPGARGADGVVEKDITLSFAKALQKLLVDTGKFDVALTREGDSFLRLEERVALARQNKADLFISIHADSFQDEDVRGASIYTRDEDATDILDKVLAEQENRVDLVAGFALPRMEDPVVNILVDLMRREMRRQAYMAAQVIVEQMQPSVRLRRFPVRQADFFVLQAPDVPSLLLELGFLSNEQDSENLTTESWTDRVAGALARGVATYFDDLRRN